MFIYIGCQNDIKLLQKKSKEKNNFRDKENDLAINYNKQIIHVENLCDL